MVTRPTNSERASGRRRDANPRDLSSGRRRPLACLRGPDVTLLNEVICAGCIEGAALGATATQKLRASAAVDCEPNGCTLRRPARGLR
ncbi:hypothetical protein MRX96_044057 [Rhipicephalus microplus]